VATAELGIGMAKISLGHEQPSGISRPLVIGLGVAVAFAAFMAGWFVLTVVSGPSGSTEVATPADDIPTMSATVNLPDPPRATAPALVVALAGNDRVLASDIDSEVPAFVPLPTPRPPNSVPFPRPRPQMAEQGQPHAEPPTFFDFLNGRAR
jgi:hypothetical protein